MTQEPHVAQKSQKDVLYQAFDRLVEAQYLLDPVDQLEVPVPLQRVIVETFSLYVFL